MKSFNLFGLQWLTQCLQFWAEFKIVPQELSHEVLGFMKNKDVVTVHV